MAEVKEYLRWLKNQVGKRESPMGSNRTPYAAMAGHANGYAWCASFVVGGANEVGLLLPPGADTASTYANEIAFKRAGRLSSTPRVGSIFFVYFPSMSRVAHTGVVWKVDGNYVHCIEGNTNTDGSREGYKVAMRVRPARRSSGYVGIRSYGMPYYGEDVMQDKDFDRIERLVKAAARDAAPSADDVAEALMRRLATQRVIPNLDTKDPTKTVGSNRTFVAALADLDRKADVTLERLAPIEAPGTAAKK